MTIEEVRKQTQDNWDEQWGEIEDYNLAFDITELESYAIGDTVGVIVDEAYDPTNPTSISAYEGDEGVVVGFSQPAQGGGPFNLPAVSYKLYVAFEDNEPCIVDPSDLDHLVG